MKTRKPRTGNTRFAKKRLLLNKRLFFVFILLIGVVKASFAQCFWKPPFDVDEIYTHEPRGAGINYDSYNRRWFITIDTSFQYAPEALLLFTRAHEYAHLYAKHGDILISNPGASIRWNAAMELEADRIAAQWLISAGCRLAVELQRNHFYSLRNVPASSNYPSYYEREMQLNVILNTGNINTTPVILPSVGIFGSVGLSSLTGMDMKNPWGISGIAKSRIGFDIGINWNAFRLGRNVAISTGMRYMNFGANISSENSSISLNIEEIYFPLILNIGFKINDSMNWEIFGGGYFSGTFLLGVLSEFKYESDSSGQNVPNFSEYDSGLLFGMNAVFKTSEEGLSILLGLKYLCGLTNFNLLDTTNVNPISTRYLGLSFGIRYDLDY